MIPRNKSHAIFVIEFPMISKKRVHDFLERFASRKILAQHNCFDNALHINLKT